MPRMVEASEVTNGQALQCDLTRLERNAYRLAPPLLEVTMEDNGPLLVLETGLRTESKVVICAT